MHSAAEELSTGPRLTTVMKPIPVRGEGERGSERGGGIRAPREVEAGSPEMLEETINTKNKCI